MSRVERSPAQQLDAVYFDTPGHDLAAHHVTLRRRTGGTDAGWHLKLPAGPDARTEVRAPLGDESDADAIPADLLDVVLAIVRDRPVRPVARITTSRTVDVLYGHDGGRAGGVLRRPGDARKAGEEGENSGGGSGSWNWPQASTASLLDRLTNRLLDAGAAPAGHGSKLARVLDSAGAPEDEEVAPPADPVHRAVAEQVEQLLVWDRAVRADVYDSVHQMRVTTRKIRSLLQASEGAFGISDDAWILDELRQLAAILGVARDAEVLAERYERTLDELPDGVGARDRCGSGWSTAPRSTTRPGLRRSLIAMRSQRYFQLLDALEGLVAAEPPSAPPGEEPAQITIDAAYKRIRKAAKAAAQAADADKDEALHRIRKGAKRLRYTAAATGDDKVSDRAKTIQTLLGDHQDSVVSRTHLSRQAEAAHAAGEDTFTYGLLYQAGGRSGATLPRAARRRVEEAGPVGAQGALAGPGGG